MYNIMFFKKWFQTVQSEYENDERRLVDGFCVLLACSVEDPRVENHEQG